MSSESTPLIPCSIEDARTTAITTSRREHVFSFLEAQTPGGRIYERFTVVLIVLNVLAFVLATLFVQDYNPEPWAMREGGICGNLCDALWFGNYPDNGLEFLNMGTTSVLEIVTVFIFTVDYSCRVWTADLESDLYQGVMGRLKYLPTFYSLVDLASTVPFYIDAFVLTHSDLVASQFLRMFRLFRMMRVEGRYDTALTMFDDVFYEQRGILGTALFVGVTTWMTVSSLYYMCERRSNDMIYCGTAPDYCGDTDDIDVSLCVIDFWGITDCTEAGCPPTDGVPEPCYNLYKSIPMASYYSLLNLFGEFPLIDQHNVAGKIVGSMVAIVAVAFFALPAGIIGNGFEDLINRRREEQGRGHSGPIEEKGGITDGYSADNGSFRGRCYNFFHAHTTNSAKAFDNFINALVLGTAITFMIGTVAAISATQVRMSMDIFEFLSVMVFTVEYTLRVYSAAEDPKYNGAGGQFKYMCTFLAIVDLLTVAPYWLQVGFTGQFVEIDADSSWSVLIKCLRLLRLLRFEKYTHAFTSFDDVISQNLDVLAVTGFTAILFWIFFAAILYFTERNSRDSEMASNYKTVPDAMWMTLLNLSGESPLAQYSVYGKFITGILGLFATGLFGIPIGVLGAGFEQVIGAENEDTPDEPEEVDETRVLPIVGTAFENWCFNFVNGVGSTMAKYFELGIYFLIFLTVGVGIWQTVEGHDNDFHQAEWVAVIIFTVEYLIRLIGVGADLQFAKGRNWFTSRVRFVISFYSIIDLLAILPFYIAAAAPSSWVNDYDEMMRMFRLLRLLKLDKYIPSITLIDDVIRLKRKSLVVAGFAAGTLWVLFSAMIYVTEYKDDVNDIDPVPFYGCFGNCTMSDRFQNYFDSMVYTGVHLTGDYPITTYSWPARFVNFFMVIAAVGVVSVPSGLIANGFVSLVQSKAKRKAGDLSGDIGDDWYEHRLREIRCEAIPLSRWGPTVDKWQIAVNEYLNGREDGSRSSFSRKSRALIFTVIVLNVAAVLAESVPEIDRYVTNAPGNFFDVFETFSVFIFATEYALRLFCAPKNYESLCSSLVYATTFFGIVDFLSTAPWFIERALIHFDFISPDSDAAMMFRIFRIFRMLQMEDFIVAFSKLDNVFRASKDVFKATGLMALIVWVGCGALFFLFEENNPNWRSCDSSIPAHSANPKIPGCYDFHSTTACNNFYPGMCEQKAFTNVPNALYYTAVFLGGEWGVIDFTWPGRIVCLFLCVVGIGLYAIPVGTLFDSFGAILGLGGDNEDEEEMEGGDEKE